MIPRPALLLLLPCLAAAACVEVRQDRVTASDLAPALPLFAALPPTEQITYAPDPGVKRTITPDELRRIALNRGLPAVGLHEVCITRESRLLHADELLAALKAIPRLAGARIEVVDFLRAPVPPGALELAASGIVLPPASAPSRPILWRGRIRYSKTRSFPFWVTFRATLERKQVVAAVALKAGAPITPAQLRLETATVCPFSPPACETIECAAGRIPQRSLREKELLRPELLRNAPDVARGDMVTVEVESGDARIRTVARAEASAAAGGRVLLMNEESQKRFSAIVTGRGTARLEIRKETRHALTNETRTGDRTAGAAGHGREEGAEAPGGVADRSLPQ